MSRLMGICLLLSSSTWAVDLVIPNAAVVPQDKPYLIDDVKNTRIIYTKDNKQYAEYTAGFEELLQPLYEKTYGYKMDTPLSVGLISSHNQIANGFSTQFPTNRQINYMGGAQAPDYFSSASWLDTLLLHETAHNYQVNAKDNAVSKLTYKVFRSGNFYLPFFPATTPNLFETSFMLEGNAVLNESWHGKGGRLYSGRYRAMNNVHALVGNLTQERLYNETLNFPYGEGHYLFGSQYQYYLAEKYGLDKTNKYFKYRSQNWYLPFTVNTPTYKTFGVYFNETISAWAEKMAKDAQGMEMAKGEILGRSKYYSDMNTQDGQVLFLTMEKGVRAPVLNAFDKSNKNRSSVRTSLALGRVFFVDGDYYSISGRHISPWRITQGLFDANAIIKDDTKGKIIQGYLSDGRQVYFDTEKSYVNPQLYVGDEFYNSVHSSVLVDDDNLYYFVQKQDKRTLYKNKQALYTFTGFYSIVSDVDELGAVYFIANSALGSSLYKFQNGSVSRALAADNIVAAKLAGNNQVIVEAISPDDYYYTKTSLLDIPQPPYVVQYMWDRPDHPVHIQTKAFNDVTPHELEDVDYGFFNTVSYTSGNIFFIQNENQETTYDINAHFTDPLAYHDLYVRVQKDQNLTKTVGFGYKNNQHAIIYGFETYYIYNNELENTFNISTRDYGFALDLKFPFLKTGFWRGQIQAGYFQDYIYKEKEPFTINIDLSKAKKFGHSFFLNDLFSLSLNLTEDRGSHVNSASIQYSTDFPYEIYAGVKSRISASDSLAEIQDQKGVELSDSPFFSGTDKTGFYIPSLKRDLFSEQAAVSELNISKVFNGSAYFFKFPLSLRREALTLAYRHYEINGISGIVGIDDASINEASLKFTFEATVVNKFIVNFAIEAIHSDNKDITESNAFLLSLAVPL